MVGKRIIRKGVHGLAKKVVNESMFLFLSQEEDGECKPGVLTSESGRIQWLEAKTALHSRGGSIVGGVVIAQRLHS